MDLVGNPLPTRYPKVTRHAECLLCPCGHPKADHDYFGCIHGSCKKEKS